MVTYSALDMILCIAAVLYLTVILKTFARHLFVIHTEVTPFLLLNWLGIILIVTSSCKAMIWLFEIYSLRSIGDTVRYIFIHYTIDEPMWITLNIVVGMYEYLLTLIFGNNKIFFVNKYDLKKKIKTFDFKVSPF